MYEHYSKPLIPPAAFYRRLLRQLMLTIALVCFSLLIGVAGFKWFENYSWIDSLLNASMLLGGMGQITEIKTDGGKIFASIYALYSQLFMLTCGGLLLIPVLHRLLHKFHLPSDKN